MGSPGAGAWQPPDRDTITQERTRSGRSAATSLRLLSKSNPPASLARRPASPAPAKTTQPRSGRRPSRSREGDTSARRRRRAGCLKFVLEPVCLECFSTGLTTTSAPTGPWPPREEPDSDGNLGVRIRPSPQEWREAHRPRFDNEQEGMPLSPGEDQDVPRQTRPISRWATPQTKPPRRTSQPRRTKPIRRAERSHSRRTKPMKRRDFPERSQRWAL
jgi:hypothetical protein